jgi:hypothetical protein
MGRVDAPEKARPKAPNLPNPAFLRSLCSFVATLVSRSSLEHPVYPIQRRLRARRKQCSGIPVATPGRRGLAH